MHENDYGYNNTDYFTLNLLKYLNNRVDEYHFIESLILKNNIDEGFYFFVLLCFTFTFHCEAFIEAIYHIIQLDNIKD